MKLDLTPSVPRASPAVASATGTAKVSVVPASDDIAISLPSASLNLQAKLDGLAAAVQRGSYQVSSEATSRAIVRVAL